ncbi:MAG TPA: PIN domain-containing protein [Chloroflexota bacterium]|nr:PIN domain-containing protein [Chloroflexota bacterium]
MALIDACVLVNAAVRDTILRAAASDAFDLQVALSRDTLDELRRALIEDRGVTPGNADYLIGEILAAFEDGLIEGYEHLIPEMRNDPKDRHVMAAAVQANATIVTLNTRHFPPASYEPFGLDVLTPDELLVSLWNQHPERMADILAEQAEALRRPRVSLAKLLDRLERDVPGFVQAVRGSGLVNLVEYW